MVANEFIIWDSDQKAATSSIFVQSTSIFPICLIWRVHLYFQLRRLTITPLPSPVASYHLSAINIIWNVYLLFQMWRTFHRTHQIRLSIFPSSKPCVISPQNTGELFLCLLMKCHWPGVSYPLSSTLSHINIETNAP